MKLLSTVAFVCLGLFLVPSNLPAQNNAQPSAKFYERVEREVRHKLLMLPYFGVFDILSFKIEGYDVVLLGAVANPTLKNDAEQSVKKVECVEHVRNEIHVLPPSPMDDRLRRQLFRAIYGYGPLQRYGVGSNRPIHIIVDGGHVTLEGAVDSQGDKNIVGIRANGVSGVFSVTNNLLVPAKSSRKSKS